MKKPGHFLHEYLIYNPKRKNQQPTKWTVIFHFTDEDAEAQRGCLIFLGVGSDIFCSVPAW